MRYWIYWNELIQGPFELDELVSLHAFDDDLLVCMEDRQDWVPASRVADLAPAVELLRSRRNRPPPPPPPSPPDHDSTRPPLQGELFGEPPGQSSLFHLEGEEKKGPYAYSPALDFSGDSDGRPLPVTMPFHFGGATSTNALLDRPVLRFTAPTPAKPFEVLDAPPPVSFRPSIPKKESPVRKPVEDIEPPPSPEPSVPLSIVPEYIPPTLRYQPTHSETEIELPPLPEVEELEPTEPVASIPEEKVEVDSEPVSIFQLPSDPLESTEPLSLKWVPWAIGILIMLALLGSAAYWIIDHSSSRSAIAATSDPLVPKPVRAITPQRSELPVAPAVLKSPMLPSTARARLTAVPKAFHQLLSKIESLVARAKHRATPAVSKTSPMGHSATSEAPSADTADGTELISPIVSPTPSPTPVPVEEKPMSINTPVHHSTRHKKKIQKPVDVIAAIPIVAPDGSPLIPEVPATSGPAASATTDASSQTPPEKKSWWHRKSKNAAKKSTSAPVPSWAVASPIDESASKGGVPLHPAAGSASTPAIPSAVPGLDGGASAAPAVPVTAPVPVVALTPAASPVGVASMSPEVTPDAWAGRQNDAIAMVMNRKGAGRQTIGDRSSLMLQEMHQKELLHAADTGERLYLPDKMNWSALREQGSVYRVYLTLSALQGNGERTEAKQYQFRIDLANKALSSDDAGTHQDFLDAITAFSYKQDPRTVDMESLLSGVDQVDKQMVRAIMIHKDRHAKAEAAKINNALVLAQARLQRALLYFRTQYSEKSLQNLAKAYNFVKALNG